MHIIVTLTLSYVVQCLRWLNSLSTWCRFLGTVFHEPGLLAGSLSRDRENSRRCRRLADNHRTMHRLFQTGPGELRLDVAGNLSLFADITFSLMSVFFFGRIRLKFKITVTVWLQASDFLVQGCQVFSRFFAFFCWASDVPRLLDGSSGMSCSSSKST